MKNSTGIIIGALLVLIVGIFAYFMFAKKTTQTSTGTKTTTPPANGGSSQSVWSVLNGLLSPAQTPTSSVPTTNQQDEFATDQASSDQAIINAYASGDTTDANAALAAQQEIALSFV